MLADAVSASVRAISFIALFQAVGMAMFLACFAAPLAKGTRAGLRRTLGRSVRFALLALILHYFLEAGRLGGSLYAVADGSLQKMVLESPAATVLGWRVLGLLLIGIFAFTPRAGGVASALIGAAITLAAFTQTGHTSLNGAHPVLPILLWIHLVIVAFWFGALLPLRRVSADEPAFVTGTVVARFTAIAFWLVPLIFVAGAVLAALLLKTFSALATPYGIVILTKAALFGVLMMLAALNKWRFGPALGRGDRAALRGFRVAVAAEYALIAAVLTLTAVLTTFLSPET